MNCANCHNPLPDGTLLCSCGYSNPPETIAQQTVDKSYPQTSINQGRNSNITLSILCLTVVGLLIRQITLLNINNMQNHFGSAWLPVSLVLVSLIAPRFFQRNKKVSGLLGWGAIFTIAGMVTIYFSQSIMIFNIAQVLVCIGLTFLAAVGIIALDSNSFLAVIGIANGFIISFLFGLLINLRIASYTSRTFFLLFSILVFILLFAARIAGGRYKTSTTTKNPNKDFAFYALSTISVYLLIFIPYLLQQLR